MAAGAYDLYIEQGTTYTQTFTWKDKDKVPITLTGYTARMQVRAKKTDGSTLLDISTSQGSLTINASAGKVTITLSATATSALNWVKGFYDLELVSPQGTVTRFLEGMITVSREVTR